MKLLSPLSLRSTTLPNRIVVPAMVTRLSGENGYVNQDIIDRYQRYAAGHVGLIVVEATAVHHSKSGPLLRLSDDAFVPGHRQLVAAVRAVSDSKIVPQIIHFMKLSRSGWRQTIDMLSLEDIKFIIRDFGLAAARARDAGYDGVELHSAHAYTLSSFLSRHNRRRDRYNGRTLEGRLALFAEVYTEVRRQVGEDFVIGARYLAEEAIKNGYALPDAKRIGLRMAQLGVDYISLSVGGKFEDAVHKAGHPVYPYTGYSGDRCMPGNWYPPLPHAHLAEGIKSYINSKGYTTPVISIGKISQPADAEDLLQAGRADLVGMARQLLADPDWVRKVEQGRDDAILKCIYCNVCKQLDENFHKVTCFLWPKNLLQAPQNSGLDKDSTDSDPVWPKSDTPVLAAAWQNGEFRLNWQAAQGQKISGYDVYRAEETDGENTEAAGCIEAVKSCKYRDRLALGGVQYHYYVRAFDVHGRCSVPSNVVSVQAPLPDGIATRIGNSSQKGTSHV